MSLYQKIVAAVDADADCRPVLQRAAEAAAANDAELLLVSAVPPLRPEPDWVMAPSYIELAEELETDALARCRAALEALCAELGITPSATLVEFGKPATVILDAARDEDADLIVVGSHTKRGLKLVGSTCYGVLHRAPVDTMVVCLP